MKKIILITIFLLTISSSAHAYNITWSKTNGPYAGYGGTLAVSGEYIYSCTSYGGFYRSTNGGASFENTSSVYAVSAAVDPNNESKLYMGSFGSGMLSSADHGKTWTVIPGQFFNNLVNSIAIDPNDTSKIYATQNNSNRLYRLNIGASQNTMEVVATFESTTGLYGVVITPLSYIIAVGQTPATTTKLFRSTDSGTSWSSVEFGGGSQQLISSGAKVFRVGGAAISVSTNEGASWGGLSTAPFSSVSLISVSPSNPNAIYAQIGGLITVSFDGGATWTRAYNGLPQIGASFIAVSPANSREAYAAMAADGIYKTTDGGANWVRLNHEGFVNNAGYNLAVNPSNHYAYAAGNNYGTTSGVVGPLGLWRSKDNGSSWEKLTNGLMTGGEINRIAVDRSRAGHIYAGGGSAAGMFKSTNNGDYWTAIDEGLTNRDVTGIVIDFPSSTETRVYIATSGNGLYYGIAGDFGVTSWQQLPTLDLLDTNLTCLALSTSAGHSLYAGSGSGRVFRFNLTSLSWEALAPLLTNTNAVNAVAVDPSDSNMVFAAVPAQGIYVSRDGGASWIKKVSSVAYSLYLDSRTNPHTTYACLNNGIYRSSDGTGETWTPDPTYNNSVFGTSVWSIANDESDYTFYTSARFFGITKGTPQIQVPQSPSWLIGSAESSSSIKWTWQQVTGEFGYKLYEPPTNLKATLGENIITKTETGLSANSLYTREVVAFTTMESVAPFPVYSEYTRANPPSNLRIIGIAGSYEALNWDTNFNPSGTKYVVKLSTLEAGPFEDYASFEANPPQDIPGLIPKTDYWFKVYAINHSGITTEMSNAASAETTHETQGPRIYNVRFDGIPLFDNDVIRPNPLITADITDESTSPEAFSPVSKEATSLNFSAYYVILGTELNSFNYSTAEGVYKLSHRLSVPLGPGTYTFYVTARDELGNVGTSTPKRVRVMSGGVATVGPVLTMPTPFKPATEGGMVTIAYTLSTDGPVDIYMYDIGGKVVLRRKFGSGTNGGRTGYNEMKWNGTTDFGRVVGNGIYVYKIISKGKVIGKGKVVVYD